MRIWTNDPRSISAENPLASICRRIMSPGLVLSTPTKSKITASTSGFGLVIRRTLPEDAGRIPGAGTPPGRL
jgi:hypothetical protein